MTSFTETLTDRLAAFGRAVKARLRGGAEGAISAEYVAILLVIAGIVAVVIGLNIDDRVESCGNQAVDTMFSESASGEADGC